MTVTINGSGTIGGVSVGGISSNQIGAVLQVVQGTYATQVSTTSLSFVTTGLAASITPTSATSKILILFVTSALNSTSANGTIYTIFRGTTSGTNLNSSSEGFGNFASAANAMYAPYSGSWLDSPSTTSSQTYTMAMAARGGTTAYAQVGNATASMILMEIAA